MEVLYFSFEKQGIQNYFAQRGQVASYKKLEHILPTVDLKWCLEKALGLIYQDTLEKLWASSTGLFGMGLRGKLLPQVVGVGCRTP